MTIRQYLYDQFIMTTGKTDNKLDLAIKYTIALFTVNISN